MRYLLAVLLYICGLLGNSVMAAEKTTQTSSSDPNVQKIAEAYALDVVDYSKKQFGITLDWSDSSIADVEKVLVLMRASYVSANPKPTEEQVMSFAKGFGSYIGEVYRRNHGAEWGMVNLGDQKFPGLKTKSGTNFWPWGRVLNRIMQGEENNVTDYYKLLLEKTP
jgi:hypothetical protein